MVLDFQRLRIRTRIYVGFGVLVAMAAGVGVFGVNRLSGVDAQVTRVTGFLWDRGRDRLWRQGIDLIGDERGGQVGKSIEDGAMFGQSEGGEFLDMTDDGFDNVAPVEQSLVEERHR